MLSRKPMLFCAYIRVTGQMTAESSLSDEGSNPISTEINENILFDYYRKRIGTSNLGLA